MCLCELCFHTSIVHRNTRNEEEEECRRNVRPRFDNCSSNR